MLKFRSTNIAIIILLSASMAADIFFSVSPLVYALIILIYIIVLTIGSARIESGFYCETYCSGGKGMKKISLTFDDGPDRNVTPLILDILARENVKGAFFCIGEKVSGNPELTARIDREGHIIGGHSFNHRFFFDLQSSASIRDELVKTRIAIQNATGKRPLLFRPPYGVTNPPLARAVRELKLKIAGWSLKSRDTVIKDKKRLLNRITVKLGPGDVVLFHDTMPHTPAVVESFIKYVKEAGYTIERPDIHLGIEAYEQN